MSRSHIDKILDTKRIIIYFMTRRMKVFCMKIKRAVYERKCNLCELKTLYEPTGSCQDSSGSAKSQPDEMQI